MSPFALYVLSLILNFFPPGKTDSSVMLGAEGLVGARFDPCFHGEVREKQIIFVDPKDPARRRQTRTVKTCRQPVGTPGEWVRNETREEGAARLEVVASALAAVVEEHAGDELAPAAGWPEGPRDAARAAVAAWGWSMGFHEGPQVGRLRGPGGDVCLADLSPPTLRQFAPPELRGLSYEEQAKRVVGLDYDSIHLCFDIGFRVLLAARKAQHWKCKGWKQPEEQLAFALYVSNYCSVPEPLGWADDVRMHTLERARARKETVFPDWYRPS